MTTKTVAAALAQALDAWKNCIKKYNAKWSDHWESEIDRLMDSAPSGSGIDSGTQLDRGKSDGNRLILQADYHHMDEWGHYDGWTQHTIRVYPHLYHGITLTISGRNRNAIKEHLYEVYDYWLQSEVEIDKEQSAE